MRAFCAPRTLLPVCRSLCSWWGCAFAQAMRGLWREVGLQAPYSVLYQDVVSAPTSWPWHGSAPFGRPRNRCWSSYRKTAWHHKWLEFADNLPTTTIKPHKLVCLCREGVAGGFGGLVPVCCFLSILAVLRLPSSYCGLSLTSSLPSPQTVHSTGVEPVQTSVSQAQAYICLKPHYCVLLVCSLPTHCELTSSPCHLQYHSRSYVLSLAC